MMYTKTILAFLFIILPIKFINSQIIPMDTVIKENNKYIFYNDNCYKFQQRGLKYSFFKDSVLLNKNIELFSFDLFHFDKEEKLLYFYSNDATNNELVALNLYTDKFNIVKNYHGGIIKRIDEKSVFYIDEDVIVKDGYKQGIKNANLSLYDVFGQDYIDVFEVISFPSSKQLLVGWGVEDDGDILGVEYDLIDKELLKLDESSQNNNLTLFQNYAENDNTALVKYYNLQNTHAFIDTFIIDESFNLFSKCLKTSFTIEGLIISDKQLKSLLVGIFVNNANNSSDEKVIIPYNPDPHVEKTNYLIYKDEDMTKADVENFNRHELDLLKNMIYAKYNKAFSDEYLNAYFNLYSFYRYKKDSRLDNVDNLLTDTDKQNLKLIQSAIKKLE